MNIPFVDLQAQYARVKRDVDTRLAAVFKHGRFVLGPEVLELEQRLSDFSGATQTVTVSSGSDALLVALLAHDIGRNDAVFLPSFTFTATAEVVLLAGATPVFVDVDSRTFNLDAGSLPTHIKDAKNRKLRPAAVIPVDLFGLPANYDEISSIAMQNNMVVVADAAQSFGASWRGRAVGTLAGTTCTSFFPAKPLGCYGDGGAVLTNLDGLGDIMRSIRVHGTGTNKYDVVRLGLNARMDTMQAAILLAKLEIFSDEILCRQRLAERYNAALKNLVTVPYLPDGAQSTWAQYTIQTDKRDKIAAVLREKGIPTAIYYPRPMHLQPAYAEFGGREHSLPNSEALCGRVLSLPMHPYMTADTADYICEAVATAALD